MDQQTETCNNCHQSFEIYPEDREMYVRFEVPEPKCCPDCRIKRRNVWRNERKLFKRVCDLCKKSFIFVYPEGTPFPVYCRDCWLSDTWDPKSFGREYDFGKPFFEQYKALFNVVPRVGIIKQGQSVNSEYTNRITDARNCYLVFATTIAENSRYSAFINNCKECLDCYNTFDSERCSECVDCFKCYNVHYAQESQECRDSKYLFQCRNLSDCFGCVNLRNKRYCILNTQYTKEEYQGKIKEFSLEKFEELKQHAIVPNMVTTRSSGSSGNWIENSKRAGFCFNMRNTEEMRYCQNVFDAKDCMDYSQWGNASELIYESVSCGIQCARLKFCNESWSQLMDSEYCMNCHSSSNLFGCNGLRKDEFCILNKQYNKLSYDKIITQIKKDMIAQGEYGEFFPESMSPFPYNETVSQELFPMTKEQAIAEGHWWRDQEERKYEIGGDIVKCSANPKSGLCTSAFRILPEDREYYQRHDLPLPTACPNCRHFERLAKRTPLKLWDRQCAKCNKDIQTSYSPDRPETVYCVECYQREVA